MLYSFFIITSGTEKKEVRSLRQLNIGYPFRHKQHEASVPGVKVDGRRAGCVP